MEFIGKLHFQTDQPLNSLAMQLGQLLGLTFESDISGRYEEFPAYSADVIGMEFALLGIPPDEDQDPESPVDYYTLLVSTYADTPSDEEIDISQYLARIIRGGNIGCTLPEE